VDIGPRLWASPAFPGCCSSRPEEVTVPVSPDRRIADLARDQYGVFSRSQAHAGEISDRILNARINRGSIERASYDVYRIAGSTLTWHQRLLAATLQGGPDCCVSHRAAAALHRYDGFRPGIVEVVHHQRRDYRPPPGIISHVTSVLTVEDRQLIGSIPVTNPIRTLIDLGAVVPIDRLEEALDGAERDGKVNRHDLIARHEQIRQRGRNGVGVLAELLDGRHATAKTPHSVLERRMLRLIQRAGLPQPECQVRVPRRDGRVAFLDLAYVQIRLGIELDSQTWHATQRQRQRDLERQNQVVLADWTILRFTTEDVRERPDYVAATLRQALLTGAARAI